MSINQGMRLELTPALKQLNCGDYSSCHECLEMNPDGGICPTYKLIEKPLNRAVFTQEKEQPNDMFFK